MKNSPRFKVFSMFLLTSAFFSNVAFGSTRTNTTRYKGELIPQVYLNEVQVTATGNSTLCETILRNGQRIPVVQLNDVTINASGIYEKNKNVIAPVFNSVSGGTLLTAVRYKNGFIPVVDGPEITVYPQDEISFTEKASDEPSAAIFKITIRQSFDRLSGFLIAKGRYLLRKLIPSAF